MDRWRATVLAALAAALPILASELNGWLLAMLAVSAGSVAAALALLQKILSNIQGHGHRD